MTLPPGPRPHWGAGWAGPRSGWTPGSGGWDANDAQIGSDRMLFGRPGSCLTPVAVDALHGKRSIPDHGPSTRAGLLFVARDAWDLDMGADKWEPGVIVVEGLDHIGIGDVTPGAVLPWELATVRIVVRVARGTSSGPTDLGKSYVVERIHHEHGRLMAQTTPSRSKRTVMGVVGLMTNPAFGGVFESENERLVRTFSRFVAGRTWCDHVGARQFEALGHPVLRT